MNFLNKTLSVVFHDLLWSNRLCREHTVALYLYLQNVSVWVHNGTLKSHQKDRKVLHHLRLNYDTWQDKKLFFKSKWRKKVQFSPKKQTIDSISMAFFNTNYWSIKWNKIKIKKWMEINYVSLITDICIKRKRERMFLRKEKKAKIKI